jgi:hypothetical protein
MLTTGIQNLPEPLARAQAAYHDGTARLAPASADRLARRVEHFASSVQFALDDPDAARHLHALTKDLRTVPRLGTLLPQVLRGAMALVGGDLEVKPAGVADVIDVYGDTAVPWLAGTPGFCETLLFADPADGQLISQTGWRDPAARAASPSVAEMIRSEVLADDDCQIRAVEDYRLVFDSARKPGPAWW